MDIVHCEMEPGSPIRTLNKFLYVIQFRLSAGTHVISQNSFTGGRPRETPNKELENMFVGSGAMILPGPEIADRVSIGAGTGVSHSIAESGFYISSTLTRKGETADYSQHSEVETFRNAKFVRK